MCASCGAAPGEGDPVEVGELALTSAQWRTFLLAPLWVFFRTAGADGTMDDPEVMALQRLDAGRVGSDDPLLAEVLRCLRSDFWGAVDVHHVDGRGPEAGLRAVRVLVEARLPEERGRRLLAALTRIGVVVSEASRRHVFGPRIDKKEQAAVLRIARTLGLGDDEIASLGLPRPSDRG